mmetsp:Transcript_41705/g.111206  ORF Transcript_41705/g.111206 Transcript_41705/m.111206 type:complete len:241 (+) Transcript_41705:150-872(+)
MLILCTTPSPAYCLPCSGPIEGPSSLKPRVRVYLTLLLYTSEAAAVLAHFSAAAPSASSTLSLRSSSTRPLTRLTIERASSMIPAVTSALSTTCSRIIFAVASSAPASCSLYSPTMIGCPGLISICCGGIPATAVPVLCCSTIRIIRRSWPDSCSVMIAGEPWSRVVVRTSLSLSGRRVVIQAPSLAASSSLNLTTPSLPSASLSSSVSSSSLMSFDSALTILRLLYVWRLFITKSSMAL